MPGKTKIEWATDTWNPVTGCSHVSPGCEFCYAEKLSHRWKHTTLPWGAQYAAENVALHPERLDLPFRWKAPRRVFVNSMSDLFHEQVPDEFIAAVFGFMAACPQHTFQVLTKRPERMVAWFRWVENEHKGGALTPHRTIYLAAHHAVSNRVFLTSEADQWPLPNVWLGISAEDQQRADERIPLLLDTPAAVRFVSLEPLLGPIDLERAMGCAECGSQSVELFGCADPLGGPLCQRCVIWADGPVPREQKLDWVIVGGESGGPPERRLVEPCNYMDDTPRSVPCGTACPACAGTRWIPKADAFDWVRSLRDQCQAAGVPFMFKQFGGPTHKSGGRLLDGRTWDEYPEVTR